MPGGSNPSPYFLVARFNESIAFVGTTQSINRSYPTSLKQVFNKVSEKCLQSVREVFGRYSKSVRKVFDQFSNNGEQMSDKCPKSMDKCLENAK